MARSRRRLHRSVEKKDEFQINSPVSKLTTILPEDNDLTTISTNEALLIAGYYGKRITTATLHKWLYSNKNLKLYHQPGGNGSRYYIFKLAFIKFITGKEVNCG